MSVLAQCLCVCVCENPQGQFAYRKVKGEWGVSVCLSSHCLLPAWHLLTAYKSSSLHKKKNSLYSGHQWEKRPKVTTKSSRGKGRRADWRKWLMIRLKQTETRRGLKPHMSAFGMLWRRSKQYLMAGTELTAQYFKHWAFSQTTAKQYSPSSFPPTSHLPCYPLPIPLRTPLSSPGRDTKGPVRQSNQELPWMAEACISPSIPGYISRQKFI